MTPQRWIYRRETSAASRLSRTHTGLALACEGALRLRKRAGGDRGVQEGIQPPPRALRGARPALLAHRPLSPPPTPHPAPPTRDAALATPSPRHSLQDPPAALVGDARRAVGRLTMEQVAAALLAMLRDAVESRLIDPARVEEARARLLPTALPGLGQRTRGTRHKQGRRSAFRRRLATRLRHSGPARVRPAGGPGGAAGGDVPPRDAVDEGQAGARGLLRLPAPVAAGAVVARRAGVVAVPIALQARPRAPRRPLAAPHLRRRRLPAGLALIHRAAMNVRAKCYLQAEADADDALSFYSQVRPPGRRGWSLRVQRARGRAWAVQAPADFASPQPPRLRRAGSGLCAGTRCRRPTSTSPARPSPSAPPPSARSRGRGR